MPDMQTLEQPRPAAATPEREFKVAVDDPAHFTTDRFGPLHHTYDRHPLMQIEQLRQLADRLYPKGQCRFIKPGATRTSAFSLSPQLGAGQTLAGLFDRIEEPSSWIALYNIETDPAYNRLLWDVLGSVRHLTEREGRVFDAHGFIFISAPPAVTPFHIDRENNFWLQIRGRKMLSVFDRTDRELVTQKDVEDFIVWRTLENVKLRDEHANRAHDFDVGPGQGVYFPSTTPHMSLTTREWTSPGDGISISIGVNFYTDLTQRAANIHACNRVLRGFGLSPRQPGESAWRDAVKYPLGRAVVALRRQLRGVQPPPGFLGRPQSDGGMGSS